MKNIFAAFIIFSSVPSAMMAQVGIGLASPNTNAMLEVSSTNKGILLPRVALTATNNPAPLSAHVAGMTVYNTATNTSVAANPVYPGEYYNDGTQWQRKTAWFEKTMLSGGTIGGDALAATSLDVPASTTTGSITTITLATLSFTLNKPSLVEFYSNISAIFTNSGIAPGGTGAGITDNAVKLCNVYYSFTSAPASIPINTVFGISSLSYTNSFSTFVPTGNFYIVPRTTLTLPAGSYTLTVNGSGGSGTAFRVTFGSGNRDAINIRATPIK
ncbi:hypothetical protein B0A69_21450 [Chryseobacterium shigense]|uniref:DUF4397 domain-containing protein n=1 Tax=Chryseobacterium shigense TaxID=297244 RepID=A0A1N7IJ42_9FLAO|nr:hypothetical protein [Chryseobacterium shigense]PQA89989.1 hypothetical protein B0A69_21450 [Chryseobacterium shigense]SIS37099.1 hypothetical protein SAMN05421639_10419 [Chryseobacterium shigense]